MAFSLYYRKTNNDELFQALEKSDFEIRDLQNYVPLYDNFFSLNSTNYNSINLNQKYYLHSVTNVQDRNSLFAQVIDQSNNKIDKSAFCKFSPLLDPLKVLTGKYDTSSNDLTKLPKFDDTSNICFPKLLDKNNSAYIDSFFTYLSSQLLHHYDCLNSIDYYGSYLGIQAKFNYNLVDDVDYLNENEYFHKNNEFLYNIENSEHIEIFNVDSRSNKKRIAIAEKIESIELDTLDIDDTILNFGNIQQLNNLTDLSNTCIYNTTISPTSKSSTKSSSSSCSSKSSNTSVDSDVENDDGFGSDTESGCDSNTDSDESDDSEEEEDIYCSIFDFPVQMICMEKCTNTLDYLMENELLNTSEWTSCLFQVIITLSIYQKTFSFTHNDLHTNNIMYVETEKQYIHYCFDGIYYKVPTYGKIYKIIDFGRSIYKFKGQTMCSDSFHSKGDAGSQYNCEPYFNENKPRLDPNFSFDLCRLACCLFDNFVDDMDELGDLTKKNKLVGLIYSWLIDDKDRNILYKTNGEERYPEFKLYKMIARTIHGAVPSKQLGHECFGKYVVTKKKINKNHKIINIDKIPMFC
tara:strand:+ start:7677 stop:9404 length:1728 start_codon:yes stop_codon:yes gene_type:complete